MTTIIYINVVKIKIYNYIFIYYPVATHPFVTLCLCWCLKTGWCFKIFWVNCLSYFCMLRYAMCQWVKTILMCRSSISTKLFCDLISCNLYLAKIVIYNYIKYITLCITPMYAQLHINHSILLLTFVMRIGDGIEWL